MRIGAIFALERIAQDSERDHIQIMEILCAYIRQNVGRDDVPLPDGAPTPDEWIDWAREGWVHPRLDVDVALRVIERRRADRKQREKDKRYRLGLERAPLRKVILFERDLTGADLSFANLQGAILWGARLQEANLGLANLQGADLMRAALQGADLGSAKLLGAELREAALQGADLRRAELQGTDLRSAKLQGAKLGQAKLQGANLWGVELDSDTSLTTANLQGAAVSHVDFTDVPQIAEHLPGMFADASVTLPGGHGPGHEDWPAHWPKFELDFDGFREEWHKWQAEPDGYAPPDPPDPEKTA